MDDKTRNPSDSDSVEIDHARVEEKILEEFNSKRTVKPITYKLNTSSFVIPATAGYNEIKVFLEKTNCKYKKLVFSIIYTAFYRNFILDDLAKTGKDVVRAFAPFIVKYLNDYEFIEGKEINFFKDYETYRINTDGVKPANTGLKRLLPWVKLCSEFNLFRVDSAREKNFIKSAEDLKALRDSDDDVDQHTLTEWFAYSTWLRRDDVGVGHELYSKLASPKALVNSFVATISVGLSEIQLAKEALIRFFKANNIEPSIFPLVIRKETLGEKEYVRASKTASKESLNKLREIYHNNPSTDKDDKHLTLAIRLIIRGFVVNDNVDFYTQRFFDNKYLTQNKNEGYRVIQGMTIENNSIFFGRNFLHELAVYAVSSQNSDQPKSLAEQLIFSWLMAYQTVQTSDIKKLKLNDFKFVKRNNGRVSHIDLEYFKGRADTVHQVKTLETNTLLGAVVLKYLDGFADTKKPHKVSIIDASLGPGVRYLDVLFYALNDEMSERVNENLTKENASNVFIKSIVTIFKNGIPIKRGQPREEYNQNCALRIKQNVFGLSAIKNSSIHSRTDTFTPTQLLNYHSHSDDTEDLHYRSASNEEWRNNAGLITRAVMQDLSTNLFRASETERAVFNSEFTQALEIIENKKNDTLAQMKLITGKHEGKLNHLGLIKKPQLDEDDSPDTIYLLDTPETVVKLLHYQDEVKSKHHLLAESASEFLFFTVLPTTEWIEELFDKKQFTKESMTDGKKLYKQYGNQLPPLFQTQIS
jgi:hypothetical protein